MHPSELKNRALSTAASAELDGFPATAEAFRRLALMFFEDATALRFALDHKTPERSDSATSERIP